MQIGWQIRRGVIYSMTPADVHRRFAITKTATGFTVVDRDSGDLVRVATLPAARAWAGIRAGETVVRRQ